MRIFLVVLLGTFLFLGQSMRIAADDYDLILEDFKLVDAEGKEQSFKALKGKNGTVVVFLSTKCPVVKGYNERINQVFNEYKSRGIVFIGINSNSTESVEDIAAHAKQNYAFPVLIDKGNVLADELQASVTPEVFLFDSNGKLVYKGAIDNDRSGQNVTENYLKEALDSLLMKKQIAKNSTKAFGCTIKRTDEKVKPESTSIIIRRVKAS